MVDAGSSYVAPARQERAAASFAERDARIAATPAVIAARTKAAQERYREIDAYLAPRLACLARAALGIPQPGDAEKLHALAGTQLARELAEARTRQQAEDQARTQRQRSSYEGDPLHDERVTAVMLRPGASWDEINAVRTEATAEYAAAAAERAARLAGEVPRETPLVVGPGGGVSPLRQVSRRPGGQAGDPLPWSSFPDHPGDYPDETLQARPSRTGTPQPANAPLAR